MMCMASTSVYGVGNDVSIDLRAKWVAVAMTNSGVLRTFLSDPVYTKGEALFKAGTACLTITQVACTTYAREIPANIVAVRCTDDHTSLVFVLDSPDNQNDLDAIVTEQGGKRLHTPHVSCERTDVISLR